MQRNVLLDLAKMEHAERIRKAEQDRLFIEAVKAQRRPSFIKSLLLLLTHS
jgi:hypothetical protein